MRAVRFRVRNFRNIDDSGWIDLERVTAFVGRNESGKTSLLKALHKFNPATPEPYDAQREFPRDRYTRDYVAKGSKGGDWSVCSVEFDIPEDLQTEIGELLEQDQEPPAAAIVTSHYDGSFDFEYVPSVDERPLVPDPVCAALDAFVASARRLVAPAEEQEEATATLRVGLIEWATAWKDKLKDVDDLRGKEGTVFLTELRDEVESKG